MTDRSADRIDAEAAAWIARLGGDARSDETEGGLQAWLAADPAHVSAFERATDLWEMLPGAAALGFDSARLPANDDAPASGRRFQALVASILLLFVISGVWYWANLPPVYQTAIGGQQAILLEDGSRVSLNTNTRISVMYTEGERRVRLDTGEALFEVAKNKARPFLVETDRGTVRALGTKFVVRRDSDRIAVTLIEGSVAIKQPLRPAKTPDLVLNPGERVTLIANAGAALDTPSIEAATAWRRGEVEFEDTTLIAAAAELNRYGTRKLVIDDPGISALHVSGVFATRDVDEFASAIAELHGLKVERDGSAVHLTQ